MADDAYVEKKLKDLAEREDLKPTERRVKRARHFANGRFAITEAVKAADKE